MAAVTLQSSVRLPLSERTGFLLETLFSSAFAPCGHPASCTKQHERLQLVPDAPGHDAGASPAAASAWGGVAHRMVEDVARRAALGSVPRIHGVSVQQGSLEGAVLHQHSSPQPCWHQGLVSGKTTFPWMVWAGDGFRMI